MRKRLDGPAWKVALTLVALLATLMALYVQLFERRSRLTEDRLSAARLEKALGESRLRLKAEILAQLRAELASGESTEPQGDQPRPNAVLRRSESGGGSALQVLDSDSQSLARFQESLVSLTRQMEQSDRQTRQDLEELRAELRREQEVSRKVVSLLLIALIPLVLHLLAALWPSGEAKIEDAS